MTDSLAQKEVARRGCPDLDPEWPNVVGAPRGPVVCVLYPNCECGDRDAPVRVVLRSGTKKRIHVNKQVIAQNRKNGTNNPPITVQTSKGPHRAHRVAIRGWSNFIHSPHKPLACGARVWVETFAEVIVT